MKTISEIYNEYKIMPNLQEHMFRVAGVASIICDNFDGSLNKKEIITACLLHDMGNIIKSNLKSLPEFLEPEGLEHWEKIKVDYIEKYGNKEDDAHIKIMQELDVSQEIIDFVKQVKFSLVCSHRDGSNFNIKIIHYADGRVDPYGIVSYEERMNEARTRYKPKSEFEDQERQRLISCGKDIEKQIFAKCKIKPEDVNNESVASIMSELRNFIIK